MQENIELVTQVGLADIPSDKKVWGYAREVNAERRQGRFVIYPIITLDGVFYFSRGGSASLTLSRDKDNNPIYRGAKTATTYLKKGEFRPGLNERSLTQIITKNDNAAMFALDSLCLKGDGEISYFEFNPSKLSELDYEGLKQAQIRMLHWVYGDKDELAANMKAIVEANPLPGRVQILNPEYVLSQPQGAPIVRAFRLNGLKMGKNPGFSACSKRIDKANFLVVPKEDKTETPAEQGITKIIY